MTTRPMYLIRFRYSKSQRAHFAIFVVNSADKDKDPNDKDAQCKGTLINVVGTPMSGYVHEFKRNYDCHEASDLDKIVYLGSVDANLVTDPATSSPSTDDRALGKLDDIALRLPAPRKNANFLAPVNDTTNRRCQEWTMDYLCLLINKGHLDAHAVDVAQAERDPANHGVGLRPAKSGLPKDFDVDD